MKLLFPRSSPTYKFRSEGWHINIHVYDTNNIHIYVKGKFLLSILSSNLEVFNGNRQVKTKDNK